ncbi:zinc carboxypeptidase-like [Pectinophora gossypiella]|uniref:zinc carboxypeptidase-like n=1 Tax=Pectinophora gossypiella TaxID=13191 RepID=UPI00214E3D24|nr:zinc carboxypeptidase-like [Pectinophora gossypiella]
MKSKNYLDVIFLEEPIIKRKIALMVNPQHKDDFIERTNHFKLRTTLILRDVQWVLDEQVVPENAFNPHSNRWTYIHTLEDIYKWLNGTAVNHTGITKFEAIGKSAEDRDIYAFSIINPLKDDSVKVIIEAGTHGNEYIGTHFTTYLINQLLNSTDPNLVMLRKKYNWYFIPVLNPDGYVYSQKEDRLWRKNRRRTEGKSIGVDLNRNFGYKFGLYDASSEPEHERYHGPSEFSEPETQVLRKFIDRKRDRLTFYFSFHGYGQKIIIPYSDSTRHLGNFHEVQTYAKQAAAKMESFAGHKYSVGIPFDLFGKRQSGDSASWVKKDYHVPYVFTVLLRDDGSYALALPNEQLLAACQEMEIGFVELMMSTPRNMKGNTFFTRARGIRISVLPFLFIILPMLIMV